MFWLERRRRRGAPEITVQEGGSQWCRGIAFAARRRKARSCGILVLGLHGHPQINLGLPIV